VSGLTDNYIRVYVEEKRDLHNSILSVQLLGPLRDGLVGRLIV